MAKSLWEKIEWVREQPESIRMRYVLGCLLVSMAFILGIWLLSLKESFRSIGQDVPAAVDKSRELLPSGGTPSLNDLLEQAAPLRADGQKEKSGQDYFNEQFQGRTPDTGTVQSDVPATP
ncbi:MAG: hypothetical protein A3E38_02275 [Candidatus Moranbacteria bacterium RIFCSPHIGHO2_12_FULL_54_9]|nr:MAG: hypothetical protein A2878_03070 [Candidatus Moranbacteria bacterium RIFCSPHIGHO2_01_FULL_54_31]OGI24972.1 MAG: hypothetical protein A3E38_02275 [Candidatus Moranbacteria bacterium RIFCSPHIGHO2_12_FULL_54_9]